MIIGLTEEAHLKDALFQSENNDPIKHIHIRSLLIVIAIDFFLFLKKCAGVQRRIPLALGKKTICSITR